MTTTTTAIAAVISPRLLDRHAQAALVVLLALACGLLLGPGEAAAGMRGFS